MNLNVIRMLHNNYTKPSVNLIMQMISSLPHVIKTEGKLILLRILNNSNNIFFYCVNIKAKKKKKNKAEGRQ